MVCLELQKGKPQEATPTRSMKVAKATAETSVRGHKSTIRKKELRKLSVYWGKAVVSRFEPEQATMIRIRVLRFMVVVCEPTMADVHKLVHLFSGYLRVANQFSAGFTTDANLSIVKPGKLFACTNGIHVWLEVVPC